jgi:hypothetical protein
MNISAGSRYPSGHKRPKYTPRHAGVNNIAVRYRHKWDDMKRIGADPVFGSEVALMHLRGVFTDAEADAALYYAEVAGRYDRYHPAKDGATPRTARAQSYEFGSRAADTEIERHNREGTIKSYERRAKKTRKLWGKIQELVEPGLRDRLDQLCLMDQAQLEGVWEPLKVVLGRIAAKFLHGRAVDKKAKKLTPQQRGVLIGKRVQRVFVVIEDYFLLAGAVPKTFQLVAAPQEFGIKVFGETRDGQPVLNSVMISLHKDDLVEHLAMQFLKHCEARGWTDQPKA